MQMSDSQRRASGQPAPDPAPRPAQPKPPKPTAAVSVKAPAPIATPKLADNSAAAQSQYWDRLKQGEGWANEHFADGSMGRMTDPRAADTQAQLDLLKERQKGMDSKEELAAREQAMSEINRDMSNKMERYASIAGAQGIRGGASMALQGRAITEATQQQADFQRKLILDNIAIKQQASDRYGNTLGQQQNTELGIQQYNNGQANAELYGRTTVPFQIAAGIDATQAGLDATSLNQAQLGLGTQQVNDARTQTWRDSQTAAADKKAATKAQAEAEAAANQGGKIICTEAERQGLISSEQLATSRAFGKSHLSYSELRSYWTWATPIVRLMRVSPAVARIVASLLPALIAEEGYSIGQEGARSTLRGRITLRCFRALNRVFLNASARKVARLAHG